MILGVIPARYGSTRFPGKPLADIHGKTMVRRVYEQAKKAARLNKVVVATDDDRIYTHVKGFGGEAIMTEADHQTGTDRCNEVLNNFKNEFSHVINIQGDEPFIEPGQIDLLAGVLASPEVQIATLIVPVSAAEQLFNEHQVKVVLNEKHEALYFSRSVIPFLRNVNPDSWHLRYPYYRHIGMYGYRADVLQKITSLPASSLEKAESLEQLRWLQNGFVIRCAVTQYEHAGIDTPEDLEKIRKLMG